MRPSLLGLVALGSIAWACASGPSAAPTIARTPPAITQFDSEALIAFWECHAAELEDAAREVAVNATGPRGPQHSRPSRCIQLNERPFAPLPVSDNAGLARLNVAQLIDEAASLDAQLRLHLDDRGSVRVRHVELDRLRARVRATPRPRRASLAPELRRRLDVASELAVRLSPLGRNFAESHAATQLIHAYNASLIAELGGRIESDKLRRLLESSRRIERAAASSTALIAVVQAGLADTVPSHTLLETARAARDTLKEPIHLSASELAVSWCPRSPHLAALRAYVANYLRDPGAPSALPTLGDIADSKTAQATADDLLLRGWINDAEVVPFVVSAVYPDSSPPRRSAETVRAVLDGEPKIALHHARALIGPSQLDLVLSTIEGQIVIADLEARRAIRVRSERRD